MMRILAISGSLRAESINTKLLRAIADAAPHDVSVSVMTVGDIPLFNPDEEAIPNYYLKMYKAQILAADAVIIASPEYAHGITGSMKNALDWVVGSGEFVGKLTAVLNAAPRSNIAYEALKEVLRTIDANIVSEASLDIPVLGSGLSWSGILEDKYIASQIGKVLEALAKADSMQAAILSDSA